MRDKPAFQTSIQEQRHKKNYGNYQQNHHQTVAKTKAN